MTDTTVIPEQGSTPEPLNVSDDGNEGTGEDMGEGIQIVSDGTVEGTHVLLDGARVRGVTEATWRFNARERKATLVLEMKDITLDVGVAVDPSVREALALLTD